MNRRPSSRLWRFAIAAFVVFAAVIVVGPALAGAGATLAALRRAPWWLLPAVFAVELLAVAAQGELIRVVLATSGERLGHGLMARVAFVRNALSRTLPAGGATAIVGTVGVLARYRVDAAQATSALAAAGVVSVAVLVLGLPVAALVAAGAGDFGSQLARSAWLAVAVGAVIVALISLVHRPRLLASLAVRGARAVARGPLRRRIQPEQVGETVRRGVSAARALVDDRVALTAAGGWAVAAWLLDLAVLMVVGITIGAGTPLDVLPLAYVTAQIAASVPITPGGLVIIEATAIAVLVAAGAPASVATAAVLTWRLVSHWLPVVVGLALLPTLGGAPTTPPSRASKT